MILEGVVTTLDQDAKVHLAPMGPDVENDFGRFVLRPFQTSQTFVNLKRTGQGVLHVTDDVELIARAAVGQLAELPTMRPAPIIDGFILTEACRWYVFRVDSIDQHEARAVVPCTVVARGTQREFFGFNRAKHAVLEAAIVATRLSILSPDAVSQEMGRLAPLVEKTGGVAERRAFEFLRQFIADQGIRSLV